MNTEQFLSLLERAQISGAFVTDGAPRSSLLLLDDPATGASLLVLDQRTPGPLNTVLQRIERKALERAASRILRERGAEESTDDPELALVHVEELTEPEEREARFAAFREALRECRTQAWALPIESNAARYGCGGPETASSNSVNDARGSPGFTSSGR